MTIPVEISQPIKDFISRNWWLIIIIISLFLIGYASMAFLGKFSLLEPDVEKAIEGMTGVSFDFNT